MNFLSKLILVTAIILFIGSVAFSANSGGYNKDMLKTMKCTNLTAKKFPVNKYDIYFCENKSKKDLRNDSGQEILNGGLVLKSKTSGTMLQIFDGSPSPFGNVSSLDDFMIMIDKFGSVYDWGIIEPEGIEDNIALGYGRLFYPGGIMTDEFEMVATLIGGTLVIKSLEGFVYLENGERRPALISIPLADLKIIGVLMDMSREEMKNEKKKL